MSHLKNKENITLKQMGSSPSFFNRPLKPLPENPNNTISYIPTSEAVCDVEDSIKLKKIHAEQKQEHLQSRVSAYLCLR